MEKPSIKAIIALLAAGVAALAAAKARTHRRALALTRSSDGEDATDAEE
jgi:hypothetical protein